ncbi:hypothetical protein XELAEV_18015600mg [Xenopus laevis]|uniref:Uncharacterized protein n=1 Tax=Xenopus laevis TaxID=8355 RepID=A0A974DIC8_XENLA|nr:hypothetical protein XELAEV_18015600mg [Xenopus laevis]
MLWVETSAQLKILGVAFGFRCINENAGSCYLEGLLKGDLVKSETLTILHIKKGYFDYIDPAPPTITSAKNQ